MPTYDYFCQSCGHKVEVFQKITDKPLQECPACFKKTLARGPGGGVGILLKGDGFYKTMNAPNETQESASGTTEKGSCCPCGKSKNSCSSN